MEITWYGGSCIRLKGREGVVAADPFRAITGPTGRGLTADIVSFSRPDDEATPTKGRKASDGVRSRLLGVQLPTSLEQSFILDGPGEYEVHDVMVTGVRTYRDSEMGRARGPSIAYVYELDGVFAAHLGDVGHPLEPGTIRELGQVDILCLGIGPQLSAAHAAEIANELDAHLVVPLPLTDAAAHPGADLERFLKEMGVSDPQPVASLKATISTIPHETTIVVLEQRGRT